MGSKAAGVAGGAELLLRAALCVWLLALRVLWASAAGGVTKPLEMAGDMLTGPVSALVGVMVLLKGVLLASAEEGGGEVVEVRRGEGWGGRRGQQVQGGRASAQLRVRVCVCLCTEEEKIKDVCIYKE